LEIIQNCITLENIQKSIIRKFILFYLIVRTRNLYFFPDVYFITSKAAIRPWKLNMKEDLAKSWQIKSSVMFQVFSFTVMLLSITSDITFKQKGIFNMTVIFTVPFRSITHILRRRNTGTKYY